MDLSPGDAVVWHGNTWHGDTVPADVLKRHANNERFKVLLGGKQPYGWHHAGPDYSLMARSPRGVHD